MDMDTVTAVILGGGQGTRLMPLTQERAKPAVGFAGKYRIIDIPISNCINSGFKRIFVLTQFLSASLHNHIMRTFQFDSFTNGFVDILAAEQTVHRKEWFQGTADAVRSTLQHIAYYDCDHILILAGDHLYRMDYSEMLFTHVKSGADITIGVYPVDRREASRMGLMKVEMDGTVQEFVEKPQEEEVIDRFRAPEDFFKMSGLQARPDSCLGSMGIYIFRPSVLLEMLEDTSHADFGKEIIPAAIGNYRVVSHPFNGYWKDIGTIRAYFEENLALAQENPGFTMYEPNWPIYTRSRALPPNRVMRSTIEDSLLVEGSDILDAKIANSIIGMRGVVRSGTELKRTIFLGADFYEGESIIRNQRLIRNDLPGLGIGRDCHIENAILDKNVRIGNGVTIRAKDPSVNREEALYWIRDGITIIPKGTVIPDGMEI